MVVDLLDQPKAGGMKVNTANKATFIAVLFAILMLVTYVPVVPMALVEFFYR